MLLQNGLDDVEPQAHAVLVLAAGFVALVEALEELGQLVGGDGVPQVADGDIGLAVRRRGDAEIEGRTRPGELGGVLQQVVDDLGDHVVVAPDQDGLLRDVRLHVQVPVGDLLLHGDEDPPHGLADIEAAAAFQGVHGLQLAHIQHPPHETGEPPALVGDDLQILLLGLRRDGPVQDAVGIARDGGHGGLQLVGDVGDEVPALALRLLQGLRHPVEGRRQLADLVAAAVVLHADVKIPLGVEPGGLGHLPDGLDLPHGGDGADREGDHQHHHGRHQEEPQEGLPHGVHGCGGRHGEDRAQGRGPVLAQHRHAHHEAVLLIEAQVRLPGEVPLLKEGVHHVPRQPGRLPVQGVVRGEEDGPVRGADEEVHVRDAGGKACEPQHVLAAERLGLVQEIPGVDRHHVGLLLQLLVPLPPGVVIAEGEEGRPQQGQCQQHHAGGDEHLLPVEALKMPVQEFLHALALSSVLPPRSSNL